MKEFCYNGLLIRRRIHIRPAFATNFNFKSFLLSIFMLRHLIIR